MLVRGVVRGVVRRVVHAAVDGAQVGALVTLSSVTLLQEVRESVALNVREVFPHIVELLLPPVLSARVGEM